MNVSWRNTQQNCLIQCFYYFSSRTSLPLHRTLQCAVIFEEHPDINSLIWGSNFNSQPTLREPGLLLSPPLSCTFRSCLCILERNGDKANIHWKYPQVYLHAPLSSYISAVWLLSTGAYLVLLRNKTRIYRTAHTKIKNNILPLTYYRVYSSCSF